MARDLKVLIRRQFLMQAAGPDLVAHVTVAIAKLEMAAMSRVVTGCPQQDLDARGIDRLQLAKIDDNTLFAAVDPAGQLLVELRGGFCDPSARRPG